MKYQYRGEVKYMIKAKVWGRQVKTPSAKMASKAHTKMISTPENKAFRQKAVDAMKAGAKSAPKGALKGEERKLYKLTGKVGMKRSKK